MTSQSVAIVTGASRGAGKGIAIALGSYGCTVYVTGRTQSSGQALLGGTIHETAEAVTAAGGTGIAVAVDHADDNQVRALFDQVQREQGQLDILVNNAGLALGRDLFDEADIDDWETMIDTNVKGVLYVTKAVLSNFIKRKSGHIINIGSTAGKEVYERGNVYCATKTSIEVLSQAMRIDLLKHKIKVTVIHPGAADTEFSLVRFKGDENKAQSVYEGYTPLNGHDIADTVFYCANLQAHVCINSLVMTCTAQANSFYLSK